MTGLTWRHRLLLGTVVAVLTFATGLTLVLVNTATNELPSSATPGDQAVATATSSLRAQGSPQAIVASTHEGRVTEVSIVGELPDGRTDAETPFRIGSTSKVFTAAVTARLVDQGALDLDLAVVDVVPWFRTADGRQGEITVRHLLNQTSGLPTWAGMVDLTEPETSLEDRIRQLSDVTLDSSPGETFQYSNKNFALLAVVVEHVTGSSYPDALQAQVIDPLGLTGTTTDPLTAGRDVDAGEVPFFGAHLPYRTPHFPGAVADGYLVSTAQDMAVLLDAVVSAEGAGGTFLSEPVRAEILTPPAGVEPDPDYGTSYGLGLRVDPARAGTVWHEGDLANVHTNMGIDPRTRDGLVVITQHNGQLIDADAPFLAGLDVVAGGPPVIDGGGYRAVAIAMVSVAALILGVITVDLTRLRGLRSLGPAGRLLGGTVPRLMGAILLLGGTFWGLGAMLGLPGPAPFGIVWPAAADLTAMVLAGAGYLALSAVIVAIPRPRRDHAGTGGA